MNIRISAKQSRYTRKTFYYIEWGKAVGQRIATGIFTYTKPKDQLQRNHNKEALRILETKRSQMILEQQAVSTGYVPQHKYKSNFLDYYREYVKNNRRPGNRHLEGSLQHFITFLKKDHLSPIEITENLSNRYRQYLLDHFNGDTPANYFARFKRVIKAATKDGYFRINPAEDVAARSNANKKRKENIEADEYIQLLKTPCINNEVREAFIFCLYQGLRWCDVKPLKWSSIKKNAIAITITQEKTLVPHSIELHPIAKTILDQRRERMGETLLDNLVFRLPTNDGANHILGKWCSDAGLEKHITWHCARLSFSILLQDENVDAATVALLLGHTTTKYVHNTYKRYRPKSQKEAMAKLPGCANL